MIGQLTELIKNIDEKVIAYGSQELLKGPLCFSQVGLLFVLMIRYIVHDPYLTQPVEIQKWTLPLNFGDEWIECINLCCVGACRFLWPLPKKGEFKLHVGYHVKD